MRIVALTLMSLGLGLAAVPRAEASVIEYLYQSGADVVATGSGSLDLAALIDSNQNIGKSNTLAPSSAFLITGSGNVDAYETISGPSSFGSSYYTPASSETGDSLGVAYANYLFVPTGYVSGTALTSGAVWDSATLSSLGLTDGTYTWTWGSGPTADSYTLEIGQAPTLVPEPASLALLASGMLALCVARRRRST